MQRVISVWLWLFWVVTQVLWLTIVTVVGGGFIIRRVCGIGVMVGWGCNCVGAIDLNDVFFWVSGVCGWFNFCVMSFVLGSCFIVPRCFITRRGHHTRRPYSNVNRESVILTLARLLLILAKYFYSWALYWVEIFSSLKHSWNQLPLTTFISHKTFHC